MNNDKKYLAAAVALNMVFSPFSVCTELTGTVYEAANISSVFASQLQLPTPYSNIRYNLRNYSYLEQTPDGYMRVYYNSDSDTGNICIEYYDQKFNFMSKQSLDMELPIWGGFFCGNDAYYIIEGKNNTEEDNAAEVIRVIKYDKSWKRVSAAKITGDPEFGHKVRYPFDYGCVKATECDGKLYVVTGHEGYVDPAYNQGHQGFLMVVVDEESMTGNIGDADLWHSFAQYIVNDETGIYVYENSEGSRYAKLSHYDPKTLKSSSIPVYRYGGKHTSAWAIPCYATADEIALSSDNVLCLGTSIDQSLYDSAASSPYNIYLTVTSKTDFTEENTRMIWITDYTDAKTRISGLNLTKINDDRFMISWNEPQTDKSEPADKNDALSAGAIHYVFIDGSGKKISSEFTANAVISDCEPVYNGSEIVYYASDYSSVNFYSIDAETGEFSKRIHRIAGESAEWDISDGVLKITGTGEMFPSYVRDSWSAYSPWSTLSSGINKIEIGEGITGIPDYAFTGFRELKEIKIGSTVKYIGNNAFTSCSALEKIVIPDGVETIGDEAFYRCSNLNKIVIPSSVREIGEDMNWTGSTWVGSGGHVYAGRIYAAKGSFAQKYAEEKRMSLSLYNDDIECRIKGNTFAVIKKGDTKLPGDISEWKLINEWNIPESEDEIENIIIKSGVTDVSTLQFGHFEGVKEVTIENGITEIGNKMFSGCTALSKISIPDSVTSIGEGAFRSCTSLEEINLEGNINSIGREAFSGCSGLTSVRIPSNIKTIGEQAFAGCSQLNDVILSNGVETVEKQAFCRCSNLKRIIIPPSVTEIGEDINWTGSYWVGSGGHVYAGKIYAPENSAAQAYAESGGISYCVYADWFPLTEEEFDKFISENGNIAVRDKYIIYCYTLNSSDNYYFNMEQNGDASIKECSRYSIDSAPDSDTNKIYYVYKAEGPGSVEVTVSNLVNWSNREIVSVNRYKIDDELNIEIASSVKGDINGDSLFSAADLLLLRIILLSDSRNVTDVSDIEAADYNEDGVINTLDFCEMAAGLVSGTR